MALNENELRDVAGGAGNWQQYAKGSYVNYSRQAAGFLGEHNCRCNTIAFGPMQNTKPSFL